MYVNNYMASTKRKSIDDSIKRIKQMTERIEESLKDPEYIDYFGIHVLYVTLGQTEREIATILWPLKPPKELQK